MLLRLLLVILCTSIHAVAQPEDRETLQGASSVIVTGQLVVPSSLPEAWRQQLEELTKVTPNPEAEVIQLMTSVREPKQTYPATDASQPGAPPSSNQPQ